MTVLKVGRHVNYIVALSSPPSKCVTFLQKYHVSRVHRNVRSKIKQNFALKMSGWIRRSRVRLKIFSATNRDLERVNGAAIAQEARPAEPFNRREPINEFRATGHLFSKDRLIAKERGIIRNSRLAIMELTVENPALAGPGRWYLPRHV